MAQSDSAQQYPGSAIIVFCFIRRGDDLLLIERALPPYQGMRTIPGGHKRYGEEIAAACLREMKEETGLSLRDCHFAGFMQVHQAGGQGRKLSASISSLKSFPEMWRTVLKGHSPGAKQRRFIRTRVPIPRCAPCCPTSKAATVRSLRKHTLMPTAKGNIPSPAPAGREKA